MSRERHCERERGGGNEKRLSRTVVDRLLLLFKFATAISV
jgi:hypothetical protein